MEIFSDLLDLCRGIHRGPVNSPHKGQWRGTLIFSLISGRINAWVNNGEAANLRRNRAHYDIIVMRKLSQIKNKCPYLEAFVCEILDRQRRCKTNNSINVVYLSFISMVSSTITTTVRAMHTGSRCYYTYRLNVNTWRPKRNDRHFETRFTVWWLIHQRSTGKCFHGSSWQLANMYHKMAPNRRQAFIWFLSLLTHIGAR